LEDRHVTISRAATTLTYPSNFMLVAAMNPCPCGFLSDGRHPCTCSPRQISQYRSRISGPLLDRMDIQVEVPAVPYRDLTGGTPAETSADIRKRVSRARAVQAERFKRMKIFTNAQMSGRHIRKFCPIDDVASRLLEQAVDRLGLSARAFNRILKIARTIADLEHSPDIQTAHISEAIQYRTLDRGREGQ
jgi:magnesium chelatase family protein